MKALILTAGILGSSILCNAQQKPKDQVRPKSTPPVIVQNKTVESEPKIEVVKFTPPVIVKDKQARPVKTKRVQKAKFTPPVIVKDSQ